MKSIYNFILEKLKLNKQSQISNWSIKDAQDGDIIVDLNKNDKPQYIFIFKNIEHVKHNGYEWDMIKYYGYYNYIGKYFQRSQHDEYWGTVQDYEKNIRKCYLASDEEQQKLFDSMGEEGYTWNSIKKEIKKR